MAVTVIGSSGLLAAAPEPEAPPLPSPWTHLFNVKLGAGYKDNVALAHTAPDGSAFLSSSAELFLSRLPVNGPELNAFVTADDKRFFSSDTVDHETLVFAQGEVKKLLGDIWQPSLGLEYLYQDQVLDVSITETNRNAIPVLGHSFVARPGLHVDLPRALWLGVEVPVNRQFLDAPLDDLWEVSTRFTIGWFYGHLSEINLVYEATHRSYDNDPALQADGTPLPHTQRAFRQDDVRLVWRHYWDKDRRWRTTTKLGYRVNDDNGGGYFDYQRYTVGEQIRYRWSRGEVTAEVKYSRYLYSVQTVSGPNSPRRDRSEVLIDLRCERQLVKPLRLFAQFEHEEVFSNLSLEEYSANTISAGVSWEF